MARRDVINAMTSQSPFLHFPWDLMTSYPEIIEASAIESFRSWDQWQKQILFLKVFKHLRGLYFSLRKCIILRWLAERESTITALS